MDDRSDYSAVSQHPDYKDLIEKLARLEQENAALGAENAALQAELGATNASLVEVRRERDRYHNILTHIPGGVLIMLGPNHNFNFTNPAYLQIANRDASILGRDILQVFPEIVEQGLIERLDEVYRTGQPYIAQELPVKIDVTGRGDLVEIFFDFIYHPIYAADGQIEGVFDFATDVTERMKSRRTLEHERRLLRELFENAPASIALLSGPNHVFELTNALFMKLIGRKPPITGKTVAEVIPEAVEQGFIDILDEVYRTKAPFIGKETLFLVDRTGTGVFEEIFVNFVYQPMLAEDGSGVENIFAHIVDITEQVVARRKVEELSHLKDEFVAIASHDLRTPITSIKGYLQLAVRNFQKQLNLLRSQAEAAEAAEAAPTAAAGTGSETAEAAGPDQPGQTAEQARYRNSELVFLENSLKLLVTAVNQSNRLNQLIERLLDYSRITQGQVSLHYTHEADLAKMVGQVVANLAMTTQEHTIRLTENTPAQLKVDFDEVRIEQVLNNLVSNAIKYSPAGSTITVGIEPPRSDASEVIIWIKDEGFGISEEQQARLFERFYRVPNAHNASKGGLGLGLYISAQILKQHGGRIWVTSKEDQGSTFFIALPLAQV